MHGKDYSVAHEGGIPFSDNPDQVYLADFGFQLRERFLYEYDLLYDSWEQDVRLEKVLPGNPHRVYPVCTGGPRLAPPEEARVYYATGIGSSGRTSWSR
jgi:hypothetical protein